MLYVIAINNAITNQRFIQWDIIHLQLIILAAKPAFCGHLGGQGTTPPGLHSGSKDNNFNFLILIINFIIYEVLEGFKIKK